MSKRRNLLFGAALSVVSLSLAAPDAFAQQAPDDVVQTPQAAEEAEAEDEVIVVTGSRIRRNPADDTIRLNQIDAEEIESRGFVNAIEALEELPFVGPGVNNQGAQTQLGDNSAFVDLLNIGQQRTLTLIDGRRSVSAVQGTVFNTGNITGSQVDATIINPALIKTVDVQTIGAGAVYGADAVAGVVNYVLDRDYVGKELLIQGGLTSQGDGGEFRAFGAWGEEFNAGRTKIVFGADYLNSDEIVGIRRPIDNNLGFINNPFSLTATDQIPNTIAQFNQLNPQIPTSGLLANRQVNAGSIAQFFFPTRLTDSANDPSFNTFVAATGLTPFQFGLANPTLQGINPLLFVGTFGLTSGIPSVPNTDPATLALGLTRLAVPTTFDTNGNPIPFDIGQIIPPVVADQDDTVGGAGFGGQEFITIRSAQERVTFNTFFKHEFSDSFRYEGDLLFAQIQNLGTTDGQGTQFPGCNATAANCGVPIFFNENPFVTPATQALLADLTAQNATSPAAFQFSTIGGQPFFALTRSLDDITGGFDNQEGNRSRTYRTAHALYGDFEVAERQFDWDVAFAFSRNTSLNRGSVDILDVEFALATDVVAGPNGPVCRQQTLAAPEPINVRNPQLTNINIATPGGLVPTQAQIDACVPLNLFGVGAASPEAIDFVSNASSSFNEATQFYGAANLTGEIINLPAGPLLFNTQFEWRRESLTFVPDTQFLTGSGRQTTGQPSDGTQRFFEGGFEFRAPIFGDDFRLPGFNHLELFGVVRVVNRTGSGTPFGLAFGQVPVASSTAPTFAAGGSWRPIEDITFRGNRSRSVRSPSLVESLGAPQTGFAGLAGLFPCNGFNVNNGPAGGIRIENCNAFEASLGLAPGTFAALFPPGGNTPAGVGGNPNLDNETSDAWTVGVVLQPRFIPGLTIQADYLDLLLEDQISLTFLGTQCFDQATFPNTVIGGVDVCETITLAIENPSIPGQFITPDTNLITGSPVFPPAIPGSLAPVQAPFTIVAGQFSNVNQGSFRQQALQSTINYRFDLNDATSLVGLKSLPEMGSLELRGQVYYIRDFQFSSSGTFVGDVNNADGEAGNQRFQTRLDIIHRLGRLTHNLQWFRDSGSVANADSTAPFDTLGFFTPEFNTFNYNIAYEVTDNLTARLIVNNLTDAQLQVPLGVAGDAIGRRFVMALQARF